jgi:hypothetical protein
MRQAWSKEIVVETILAHLQQGANVSNLWQRDPNLYATAKRFFGNWRNACKAAGIKIGRKRWTRESLLEFIHTHYGSPDPRNHMYLKLIYGSQGAAKRLFGSWSAAVEAAGFQPKICRKWSKEKIIKTIRQYHAQGIPFHRMIRQDRRMSNAALRYFGGWRRAVRAAGFDVKELRRWSKPKIIAMLRQCRCPVTGKRTAVIGSDLGWAARKYFGSLPAALEAAGIPVPKPWSAQRVIDTLQERQQGGLSLTKPQMEDSPLYSAACRYFGNWRKALVAAGFPVKPHRKWSKEIILAAIQAGEQEGLSPQEIWRRDPLLAAAAIRYFRRSHLALKAAGLTPRALLAAGISPNSGHKWDKEKILAEIQSKHKQGRPLSHFWKEESALFHAACRHFGNWQNVLKAAGYPTRRYRRWSKEKMIEELQSWRRASPTEMRRIDPNLARVTTQFFGTLNNAWEALGFTLPAYRWSKTRVIEAIQDGYIHGRPLRIRGLGNKPLAAAAKRYFGSWPAAVAAAGFSAELVQPTPTRRWSPQKVLEAIHWRKQQGLSLTSVWRDDSGLYCQAKHHFGGWRTALAVAGFPITLDRRSNRHLTPQTNHKH